MSKLRRRALLGNYTPGHIVPKDNMEKQLTVFKDGKGYELLSQREQEELENLLLGPYRRGLYTASPNP